MSIKDNLDPFEEVFFNKIKSKMAEDFDLAEKGDQDAQFKLALAYLANPPSAKFADEAIRLMGESASKGNINAIHQLGCQNAFGEEAASSISQSIELWSKSAESGNPYSMFNIGVAYKSGNGMDKDLNEAKEWFELAFINGYRPDNADYDTYVDYQGLPITKDLTAFEYGQSQNITLTDDNFTDEMARLVSDYSSSINDSIPISYPTDTYYGVKGWLLFFCIGLTIINPLFVFVQDIQAINQLSQFNSSIDSSTKDVLYGGMIIDVIFAVLGIYFGSSLWSKKKGAATATFLYLVVRSIVYVVFGLAVTSMNQDLGTQMVTQSLMIVAIWGTYLKVSKRVKSTFPEG
jgi:hypothetical protein